MQIGKLDSTNDQTTEREASLGLILVSVAPRDDNLE